MGAGPGMGNVSAEYQKKLIEDWKRRDQERQRGRTLQISLDDPDLNALALEVYQGIDNFTGPIIEGHAEAKDESGE